jgi:hypothetical protein
MSISIKIGPCQRLYVIQGVSILYIIQEEGMLVGCPKIENTNFTEAVVVHISFAFSNLNLIQN